MEYRRDRLFVRSTRYLTDTLQLGANFNLQEQGRASRCMRKSVEVAVDLTWWCSKDVQVMGGYTYQRLTNPVRCRPSHPLFSLPPV